MKFLHPPCIVITRNVRMQVIKTNDEQGRDERDKKRNENCIQS